MKNQPDPIAEPNSPDRVFYATGTLLSAEDFVAEQSYHRGRLARVMAALHGHGTIAGLRVDYKAADAAKDIEEQLQLTPGLALDRLGRLIEVPRLWCLRINRWFDAQPAASLKAAFNVAQSA